MAQIKMKVKAISIWLPWAFLIAVGAKKYETRSWPTNYRGPLLICAAKRSVDRAMLAHINQILRDHGHERISISELYPGHAVAVVDLTECVRTELFKRDHPVFLWESLVGDFSSGRYAWKLENVLAIKPFPVKAARGFSRLNCRTG